MARTRAATYGDQRTLILARAAELFADKGYSATSMNDVAAACAVSKATLYHYVRDKRALLASIAMAHVERLEQEVAAQKRVVAAFAATVSRVRPDLKPRATPLAMLLFGMINWTFTWLDPDGPLTHADLAPMVVQLFFGGLPAVAPPRRSLLQVG